MASRAGVASDFDGGGAAGGHLYRVDAQAKWCQAFGGLKFEVRFVMALVCSVNWDGLSVVPI